MRVSRRRRSILGLFLGSVVASISGSAFGDDVDDDVDWSGRPTIASIRGLPPMVITNAYGGGSGALARGPRGLFVGADGGVAVFFASGKVHTHAAPAFGLRAGYQWRNGLAVAAGFDDLGVEPLVGGGPLLVPAASLRYSFPTIVEPFAEALVGGAFNQKVLTPTGGLGIGIAVPVARHLTFELSLRDWILRTDGSVRNVPTFELGATTGYIGG